MENIKAKLRKYWGHIVVASAGAAALVAAITPTTMDEKLGSQLSGEFKHAYERGLALQPSTTTPAE
ncbi:hypothetical protein UFOVP315_15 [uncultured Caudovirales phage]|uniref:Uncharacterized protein n=1 Tax=uncultured Caudovirales phage TaxID=2100421 RepID=A0A6J5LYU7_9CAUD|nr:hypothetical protein UFOVP315_15 [uncultured Caudovirales phage]